MTLKERRSNIELLRIIAILGVVVLHYNHPQMGGGIAYVEKNSINFYVLYSLESLFACCVNLFILISGYFLSTSKKRNIWKPIELIVQVILFNLIIFTGRCIVGNTTFSIQGLIMAILPNNYFIILYCVLYFASLFLNKLVDSLSCEGFKKLIVFSVVTFSIYPTIVDVISEVRGEPVRGLSSIGLYGSQYGYSVVNFILMYLIGAYIRKGYAKISAWRTKRLVICLLGCVVVTLLWARMNDEIGFFEERSAWEYCNPIVVLEAVILFLLFEKMNIKTNRVINKLSEGAFSVFLLHGIILPYIRVAKFVNSNVALMMLHLVISCIIIYIVCWFVHVLYHYIIDRIWKKITSSIHINYYELG